MQIIFKEKTGPWDLYKGIGRICSDNKGKSDNDIIGIIMDTLYDDIVSLSGNRRDMQLALLIEFLERYDRSNDIIKQAIPDMATFLPHDAVIPQLVAIITNKDCTIEERAELIFKHIKINSHQEQQEQNSETIPSRNSRADSEDSIHTMWDDDDEDEIESKESKNRELVGRLYEKSIDELLNYCDFLSKTITQLDLKEENFETELKNIRGSILKLKLDMIDIEHSIHIQELLNFSVKAIDLGYNINIVGLKIDTKEKIGVLPAAVRRINPS